MRLLMQSTLDGFLKPGKRPRDADDITSHVDKPILVDQSESKAFSRLSFYQELEAHIPVTWRTAISKYYDFKSPAFTKLKAFLVHEEESATIFPPSSQVFSALDSVSLQDVKVVILGQDPYHGDHQAHGMAFSVCKGVPVPPSLRNMYKELATDIDGFVAPKHGYLMGWANQGVLLLNTSLTVRAHNAQSHAKKGWEQFTDAIIKVVNALPSPVVFLLWGGPARTKVKLIDSTKHYILEAAHPSPLSAHRGFLGCKHFSRCNELLAKDGIAIEWGRL